ncbi:hypothetical protein MP228_011850 [Amoeboaphelidium protococcarum]|nr:hypothetical protein MP228_011850 [Amoeboaphelidium protococcarum]
MINRSNNADDGQRQQKQSENKQLSGRLKSMKFMNRGASSQSTEQLSQSSRIDIKNADHSEDNKGSTAQSQSGQSAPSNNNNLKSDTSLMWELPAVKVQQQTGQTRRFKKESSYASLMSYKNITLTTATSTNNNSGYNQNDKDVESRLIAGRSSYKSFNADIEKLQDAQSPTGNKRKQQDSEEATTQSLEDRYKKHNRYSPIPKIKASSISSHLQSDKDSSSQQQQQK